MPRTQSRNRVCGTKDSFPTKADASRHLSDLIASGTVARGTRGAYQCKFCHKFHTGHRVSNVARDSESEKRRRRHRR